MDPPSWSKLKSAVFVCTSRPAYLVAICSMIYLLWDNKSPFLKRLLSHRFWSILARLSFGVYLVFPIVAGLFGSSMMFPLYLTYNEMIYQMFYSIIFSFIAAIFVFVFF